MAERPSRTLRCAIYTRKSSEEGLEQDFNSLHAQREACEAYIVSQRHEGWSFLPAAYDDGGYSGGTLERPALQRLLADVSAGQIDVIVVYKVDRLTRSLSDFARIVDILDARGASFVSVTQAFNTTTSMGRLTLNVLLSFAQFEREVTGERIRDKIAASKKKGLWMGGFVPMGYAARDRSLVIVEEEARIIRHIFARYLELGSVGRLADELARDTVTTPERISQTHRQWGERRFSRGHLYAILKNPLYAGQIAHKGVRYEGQHAAIIDRVSFEAVQALLADHRGKRILASNAREPSLLAGLLVDEDGRALTADHSVKDGKRYRYYVMARAADDPAGDPARPRLRRRIRYPAGGVEDLVISTLVARLADEVWLVTSLAGADASPEKIEALREWARDRSLDLSGDTARLRREALLTLVERTEVSATGLSIIMRRNWMGDTASTAGDLLPADEIRIGVAAKLIGRGHQESLVIRGSATERPFDIPRLKALARGVTWYEELKANPQTSLVTIARREEVTEAYVGQLVRHALVGPREVERVMMGETASR